MIVRFLRYCVFLCLAVQLGVKAEVKVENHAYKNVLISFAPNVLNDNGHSILNSLQELLQNTSRVLRTAIGIRIGTVTVRFPNTWDVSGFEGVVFTSEGAAEKPDILVDATKDSAFGKQPTALQHGGCGTLGHQITIPLDFLSGPGDFPKEKLLAREWLKYRYGVFDENGFEEDSMYPDCYTIPGTSDTRITQCTHPEVEFDFKQPNDIDVLYMDDCRAHPKEESAANVTSSLMFFHKDLPQMEQLCGEEHPHKADSPSKHNTLCNGKSIWEVLKSSSDFTSAPSVDEGEPIQFSFIQEPRPRVAVVWENTENFFDKRSVIVYGIKRFLYDLPPQSKCGLYSFTNEPKQVVAFSELTEETKATLSLKNDFVVPVSDVCITCGLSMAVDALKKDNGKGTIILIADSSFGEDVADLRGKLEGSDLCLNFIIYSSNKSTVQSYEVLKDAFSCISVHDINDEDEASSFEKMYDAMQHHLPKAAHDYEEATVATGFMSYAAPLSIPMTPLARLYTLWLNDSHESQYIECKAGEAQITLVRIVDSALISSYVFEAVNDDTITEISCKLPYPRLPKALAQVRMTTSPGHYFDIEVWTSDTTPANENQQMPVIIYARINFGRYPVKNANVTATVTMVGAEEKIQVQMFDNGRGDPDITQFDGIYSGLFVDFVDKSDYEVVVIAKDVEGKTMIGKEGSDVCCGSEVNSKNASVPPFQLQESSQFSAKSKKPADGYPPSRVLDLRIRTFNPPYTLTLWWTAPGGGKAESYTLKSFSSREDALKKFDDGGRTINVTDLVLRDHGSPLYFVLSLYPDFKHSTTHYLALRALNGFKKHSEVSNVVEFFLDRDTKQSSLDPETTTALIKDDTKAGGTSKETIGIIVGVLAAIVVICICVYLGIYFFVQKPKRKEEEERNRRRNENGGDQRNSSGPPGQTALNSIPADVIIKHHNEVVAAKSQHKDPPIFSEVNLDSFDSTPELPENTNRNNNVPEYSQVQKAPANAAAGSSQQDPSKSPKRMTFV